MNSLHTPAHFCERVKKQAVPLTTFSLFRLNDGRVYLSNSIFTKNKLNVIHMCIPVIQLILRIVIVMTN